MSRVERILELTDLLTEAEAIILFDAADVSDESLKTALASLTQYSHRRRRRIYRMVKRLQEVHSASLSPSASSSA